jgi:CBS domain-containing protein
MLADGLWFAFEPEGPDVAGTVARPVPLVDGSTSAGVALRQMRGHTGLVITEEGEVVGLLAEHDVMALAPTMLPADRRVDETASHPVTSVPGTASSRAALQKMGEGRMRHLAVVDDGALVGVVSLRDVVAGWVGPDARIRDVCTADPLTIPLGTSLRTAASLMAERDVGCLPVVNGTGDLVAILTRSDIVESLAAASDDEDLFA